MTSEKDLIPQLVETTGPHSGRVHTVAYGEHIIGRGRTASINLDDRDVSRQHARLIVAPEGITVHDLGSKNGLSAGGQKVSDPVLLGHGDTISIGDITLEVRHPPAQVAQALAAGGETTATITNTRDDPRSALLTLLWPAVGVVVFGVLVAAMLPRC